MEITKEYKQDIMNQCVDFMLTAWESGTISEPEQYPIAKFILNTIDTINTQEQLIEFLTILTQKWNFFEPILVSEKEKVEKVDMNQKVKYAEDLAKEGNVEQALVAVREAKKGE